MSRTIAVFFILSLFLQASAQSQEALKKHPLATEVVQKWLTAFNSPDGDIEKFTAAVEGLKRSSQQGSPYQSEIAPILQVALNKAVSNIAAAASAELGMKHRSAKSQPHRLAEDLLIYFILHRDVESENLNLAIPNLWVGYHDPRVRLAITYWISQNFLVNSSEWSPARIKPIIDSQVSGVSQMIARLQYNSENDLTLKVKNLSRVARIQINKRYEKLEKSGFEIAPLVKRLLDEAAEIRKEWSQQRGEMQALHLASADNIVAVSPLDEVEEYKNLGRRAMRGIPDLPMCEYFLSVIKKEK